MVKLSLTSKVALWRKATDAVKVLHFIVESEVQRAPPSHTAGIKNRPEIVVVKTP